MAFPDDDPFVQLGEPDHHQRGTRRTGTARRVASPPLGSTGSELGSNRAKLKDIAAAFASSPLTRSSTTMSSSSGSEASHSGPIAIPALASPTLPRPAREPIPSVSFGAASSGSSSTGSSVTPCKSPLDAPLHLSPASPTMSPAEAALAKARRRWSSGTPSSSFLSPTSTLSSPPSRRRVSAGPYASTSLPGWSAHQHHHHSGFVGSYETSLLSGRMAELPSRPFPFLISIGAVSAPPTAGSSSGRKSGSSALSCPPHLNMDFEARYYRIDEGSFSGEASNGAPRGTPYVATVDLEGYLMERMLDEEERQAQLSPDMNRSDDDDFGPDPSPSTSLSTSVSPSLSSSPLHFSPTPSSRRPNRPRPRPKFPGYRVPPKGQVQIIIKNENATPVKVFLVPYDLEAMPRGTKTVVRQKGYLVPQGQGQEGGKKEGGTFQCAVQLQFCSPPAPITRSRRSKPCSDGTSLSPPSTSSSANPGKIYLHKSIRVVFHPTPVEAHRKLRTVTDFPFEAVPSLSSSTSPSPSPSTTPSRSPTPVAPSSAGGEGGAAGGRYAPYAGPDEAWMKARKARARREAGLLDDELGMGLSASMEAGNPLGSPPRSGSSFGALGVGAASARRRSSLLATGSGTGWTPLREALEVAEHEEDSRSPKFRSGLPVSTFRSALSPSRHRPSGGHLSETEEAAVEPLKFERIASPTFGGLGTSSASTSTMAGSSEPSGLSTSRPGSRTGTYGSLARTASSLGGKRAGGEEDGEVGTPKGEKREDEVWAWNGGGIR